MFGNLVRALIYLCFLALAFYLAGKAIPSSATTQTIMVVHIIGIIFVLVAILVLYQLFWPHLRGYNWWGRKPRLMRSCRSCWYVTVAPPDPALCRHPSCTTTVPDYYEGTSVDAYLSINEARGSAGPCTPDATLWVDGSVPHPEPAPLS